MSFVDDPVATDVLVVGGGPAGSAAAIWCALHDLRVRLVERKRFPRPRPGETLHPGVRAVLTQLGVEQQVALASRIRHAGIRTTWGNQSSVHVFDQTNARNTGYQVAREHLDRILLDRARHVGVAVVQPCERVKPFVDRGRVAGVCGESGTTRASYVMDATGTAAWMTRALRLRRHLASPKLLARYGYCRGALVDRYPTIVGDRDGWTWCAEVDEGLIAWTRLSFQSPSSTATPSCVSGFPAVGRSRGVDVTWRRTLAPAGPGYFIVGDAAVVLDPASSHGVLRALMSGIMAAHTVLEMRSGALPEPSAIAGFCAWTATWFNHDVTRLRELYAQLDANFLSDTNMSVFEGESFVQADHC